MPKGSIGVAQSLCYSLVISILNSTDRESFSLGVGPYPYPMYAMWLTLSAGPGRWTKSRLIYHLAITISAEKHGMGGMDCSRRFEVVKGKRE